MPFKKKNVGKKQTTGEEAAKNEAVVLTPEDIREILKENDEIGIRNIFKAIHEWVEPAKTCASIAKKKSNNENLSLIEESITSVNTILNDIKIFVGHLANKSNQKKKNTDAELSRLRTQIFLTYEPALESIRKCKLSFPILKQVPNTTGNDPLLYPIRRFATMVDSISAIIGMHIDEISMLKKARQNTHTLEVLQKALIDYSNMMCQQPIDTQKDPMQRLSEHKDALLALLTTTEKHLLKLKVDKSLVAVVIDQRVKLIEAYGVIKSEQSKPSSYDRQVMGGSDDDSDSGSLPEVLELGSDDENERAQAATTATATATATTTAAATTTADLSDSESHEYEDSIPIHETQFPAMRLFKETIEKLKLIDQTVIDCIDRLKKYYDERLTQPFLAKQREGLLSKQKINIEKAVNAALQKKNESPKITDVELLEFIRGELSKDKKGDTHVLTLLVPQPPPLKNQTDHPQKKQQRSQLRIFENITEQDKAAARATAAARNRANDTATATSSASEEVFTSLPISIFKTGDENSFLLKINQLQLGKTERERIKGLESYYEKNVASPDDVDIQQIIRNIDTAINTVAEKRIANPKMSPDNLVMLIRDELRKTVREELVKQWIAPPPPPPAFAHNRPTDRSSGPPPKPPMKK